MQFYTEFINRKTTCETWVTAFKGIIDNKRHKLKSKTTHVEYESLLNPVQV